MVPPDDESPGAPLPLPSILWVELTSKCPFDCKFCSRRLLRGEGEHMDFELYRSLISQLRLPQIIRLNYSGESIHYPRLVEAIRLAGATGAWTELVTAFASISERHIPELVESGLDRLTVSLHTTDPNQFGEIYRFSSLAALRSKLERLQRAKARAGSAKPYLDFAFVAMRENLAQLPRVAAYARDLGVSEVFVHPVLRRDPIPEPFGFEVQPDGLPTGEFRELLRKAVAGAQAEAAEVRIQVSSPVLDGAACVGERPVYYPEVLPPGARIYSCDQSPWETAHILANGDVVPCEVHDRQPVGNLRRQTLAGIWHGEPYQQFRRDYAAGRNPRCSSCPWKLVYTPAPLEPAVDLSRGSSAQLQAGWHGAEPENRIVWSSGPSSVRLARRSGRSRLQIEGVLPAADGGENTLEVLCGGERVGVIRNRGSEPLGFCETLSLPRAPAGTAEIQFVPDRLYWPARSGASPDFRGLGFGLRRIAITSKLAKRRERALGLFESALRAVDRAGHSLRRRALLPSRQLRLPPARRGISVLVPERDNRDLLAECLASLRRAVEPVEEPVEAIVIVNGCRATEYHALAEELPEVRWHFVHRPLGFSQAARRGLSLARHDWVYLLNNDMTLHPDALVEVLRCRDEDVFAIASQIFLKDPSRRREETNCTDFRLIDGRLEIFDAEPEDARTVRGSFYAGGGSSLFRKALLERFISATEIYDPFYWEDVEWGAVARRLGFEVLFCPASHVRHVRRATIEKFYEPAEIDRIWGRNAMLFQLRNLPGSAPLEALFDRAREMDEQTLSEVLRGAAGLLRARAAQFLYPRDEACLYGCRQRVHEIHPERRRGFGRRAEGFAPSC